MRWCDDFIWVVFSSGSHKNESMSKSSIKCRLWMAWESRLWEDLIYFAPPENSGKTVQSLRLILLSKAAAKNGVCPKLTEFAQHLYQFTRRLEKIRQKFNQSVALFFGAYMSPSVPFSKVGPARKSHFLNITKRVTHSKIDWQSGNVGKYCTKFVKNTQKEKNWRKTIHLKNFCREKLKVL